MEQALLRKYLYLYGENKQREADKIFEFEILKKTMRIGQSVVSSTDRRSHDYPTTFSHAGACSLENKFGIIVMAQWSYHQCPKPL